MGGLCASQNLFVQLSWWFFIQIYNIVADSLVFEDITTAIHKASVVTKNLV